MQRLIKGKPVIRLIDENVKNDVSELKKKDISPKLTIIRVGAKPSDLSYENGALRRMAACNIETDVKALPEDISQEQFIEELKAANNDKNIHGILVFRPLPKQLDENIIKYIINPIKDVDGMHPINMGKVFLDDDSGFPPCTAQAVIEILEKYNVNIEGADITMIGASNVVGKPLASLLLNREATVTICHILTKDTKREAKKAEIVIVAVGNARFITQDFINEKAIVIDVGINIDDKGKLCGDVDFENVKAAAITPVPGGVGSVTTAILAKHTIKACKMQNEI